MRKKTLTTLALSAVMALCVGVGIETAQDNTQDGTITASAALAHFEVDSVEIHPHSNTNTMMYMMMSTMDGQMALTGYESWLAPDDATNALKAQMTINGKSLAEVEGAFVQYMDIANAFCVGGYYIPDGGSLVIPEGATLITVCTRWNLCVPLRLRGARKRPLILLADRKE